VKALDLFPLPKARETQVKVVTEVEKAYANGYRYAILEAPVGSGKSAIAITFARLFGKSHIITPRKSLQNQYFSDFSQHLVLMKGRQAYPCKYPFLDDAETPNPFNKKYIPIIDAIRNGRVQEPQRGEPNCADGPCKNDTDVYASCVDLDRMNGEEREPCPYTVAVKTAQDNKNIVHNLHSFIFQTQYTSRFDERPILIIDEAHEIEGMIREFISKRITIKKLFPDPLPKFETVDAWCEWFLQSEIVNTFSEIPDRRTKRTPREVFKSNIESFKNYSDVYKKDFAVTVEKDALFRLTKFTFTPSRIDSAVGPMLFKYGQKVLLMSGTIYSKDIFCRNLGIRPEEAYFLRLDSSFPISSRPVYLKKEYTIDTSHAAWNDNFPKLVETIKTIMNKFPDTKGLIHTPSYKAGEQLYYAIKDSRLVIHERDNFLTKLEKFFVEKDNKIFISPVCQQGVDFKDDRARFQIVVRIPYPNTNDPFIAHKVQTDFPWYNYQALIAFGQQIGRINRSEEDFGVTILIDERFTKFLRRNRTVIPSWLLRAIIY
jgi:ATP-dependent DNA helicase DinG